MHRSITIALCAAAFIASFLFIMQPAYRVNSVNAEEEEGENQKLEAQHIRDAVRWYQRQRIYPATTLPDNWRENALRHIEKHNLAKQTSTTSMTWRSTGPNNVGGRTRAIAISPADHNVIYAAGVSGGVWKSTDAGESWTPKSDLTQNLIVSCLAIDPNNSNTIYAGTGEGFFNIDALRGSGVLKSTDGGDTWTLLQSFNTVLSSVKYYYIYKIVVRSDNSNILYAALLGGVYQSTNAGASWNRLSVGASSYFCTDLVADPNTPTTLYAAFGFDLYSPSHDGVYKTTNGGSTWSKLTTGFPTSGYGRISLAIGKGNSQILYACLSDSAKSNTYGIEKTTNGGANWFAVAKPQDNTSAVGDSHLGNQGWYNNVITVDPTNADIAYTGGINLFKTVNGGTSWSRISDGYGTPYVHVDQHAITIDPTNVSTVYFGNDGGIFKSTDGGGSFSAKNSGYITTQFYSCAFHPTVDIRIGGTQDNGTLKTNTSSVGNQIFGGDGGYTAIDYNTPTTYYTEYVYLSIRKTTNGSSSSPTWSRVLNGIPTGSGSSDGTTDRCAFIAPFVMDPSNPQVLVAGTFRIYRTTNGASSWSALTTDLTGDGDGSNQVGSQSSWITAITIAPSNSSTIYVGTSGSSTVTSRIIATTNLFGSYSNVTKAPLPDRFVSSLAVDAADNTHVFAGFQGYNTSTAATPGHIFESTNTGTTWTDISGDLPDIPVNKLLIDPDNAEHIIAATDLGVFETMNGGTNWVTTSGSGSMPNVPVFDLSMRRFDRVILAATHGRGMYQSQEPLSVKEISSEIPASYSLGQNYPNPFNPTTTIPFSIMKFGNVRLIIYDVIGREIATILDRPLNAGSYSAAFDGSNFSSGVYYYRLTIDRNVNEIKKMVMVK
jgi:photosystem II stability/assembly factor-like uncharacterized protein